MSEPNKQISKKYGIMFPNGELARVKVVHNGDNLYACGSQTFCLSDEDYYDIWSVDDISKVIQTISMDIGWFNSQYDTPCWGKFEREDMTPVEIVTETTVTPLDNQPPFCVERLLDCHNMPHDLVVIYAKKELPERKYVVSAVNYPKDDMEKLIGQPLIFGSWYNQRKLIAVCDLPDEYLEPCRSERTFNHQIGYCLLIMTNC